ncbi:MAG: ATP-binding cassette domain-containing protein [Phycisphaerae bacterium]|jgi:ABC-type sugar transport system ATPase subunit|nr:ATP-binding cassette domain-containing protein [Phycisphaerae bacterium]
MSLVVEKLSYEYSQGNRVLDGIAMNIEEGELVALVGPSGCGKSTLLHCIVGLLTPCSGVVCVAGNDVTKKKPHERAIGIMMQDQPLYEHLSVAQNIAFPLRARGQREDISDLLAQLGLTDIAKQKVSHCSGGERRRVAFGRAIVTSPKVLLLDEPFVSLNAELRTVLREHILCTNVPTLLVTHNYEEAKELCDRVIELDKLS